MANVVNHISEISEAFLADCPVCSSDAPVRHVQPSILDLVIREQQGWAMIRNFPALMGREHRPHVGAGPQHAENRGPLSIEPACNPRPSANTPPGD